VSLHSPSNAGEKGANSLLSASIAAVTADTKKKPYYGFWVFKKKAETFSSTTLLSFEL
jgi:hypothetical protein